MSHRSNTQIFKYSNHTYIAYGKYHIPHHPEGQSTEVEGEAGRGICRRRLKKKIGQAKTVRFNILIHCVVLAELSTLFKSVPVIYFRN
jgi:hypothetical protein